jgi:membrane protease YdiL (CAAX protease family)
MIASRQWQSLAEVVLCSGYPTQLVLGGVAALLGLRAIGDSGTLALPFVVAVSAADTVLLTGLAIWFLRLRGESPRAVLLGPRPPAAEAAFGLLLAPAVVVFMSGGIWWLRQVLPRLQTVAENPFETMARSPEGAIVLLLVAVIAGGVREEVQRAFLLHRFRQDLGGAMNGLILTSAAFGLGHVVQGWDAAIVTGLLGAFWATLYLTRASLLPAMVSHALANGAQVGFAYLKG